MESLRYAFCELVFRRGRSLVTVISIVLAVLAAAILTALASVYGNALEVPIETVGADVYLPLAPTQALATAAPEVRALHLFAPHDINLVRVKAEGDQLHAVVTGITALLGKKGVALNEPSMRQGEAHIFASPRISVLPVC